MQNCDERKSMFSGTELNLSNTINTYRIVTIGIQFAQKTSIEKKKTDNADNRHFQNAILIGGIFCS